MKNDILKGKKGIISGALDSNSLAWKTALRACEEGAEIILTNTPYAIRLGKIHDLASQCNTAVIPVDATNIEDIETLFTKTQEHFGGKIDFILHSIGMSPNIRKKIPYHSLNYHHLNKTLDISALSFHKMLSVAYKNDSINEYGSVVTLSYIAAQKILPNYSDMADAKAMLESVVRGFGYHYGKFKKVRVNSVSQSPTRTTAGSGIPGFDTFINSVEMISPLGNADADSCADYIMMLFSDYTRKVTMQNLYHDGGFSNTLMSNEFIEMFEK